MNIQVFSEKTGIPKSTLRFYEEKALLVPIRNKENGYRFYTDAQVELAKLIASLRLINVPLKEVQQYVASAESERQNMRRKWMETIRRQLDLLNLQLKFLDSNPNEEIFLMEKETERILWFSAEERQGRFAKFFQLGREELEKHGVKINHSYLKHVSGRENVRAMIGFGIANHLDVSKISFFEVEEQLSKSLCVATYFRGNFTAIEDAYQSLIKYIVLYNYAPAGPIMEMYQGEQLDAVTIFMPVMKLGGE
ncbi:MerR family transcriptional regulator [Ornithinibacillus bavariensis]|uniref:MerR family transcriptional regulator n=1 Tax=Ornithinibacillus bavariensis TaxID=545502 RepID=UPI000EE0C0B8|nr:hypothetical protein [Ornithinibacillus sp.]